ncbi:riboflavin synthase [Porphyrobacter sp. LM 6]|jgi:riboflavin synthase|uniref:riboflavin synthase n=1 Tax=Porphyrobacter sp. LM 6 TaxID=1896196 RepID=UPI0008464E43|nr:riboflavin synthase [Porphyrobacter sp. LM 6]AOL95767.1 riboflavin synthase alpha chain [Porphyrobacter sp. LM 6]
MFTGIVTAIGTIAAAEQRGDLRLRITAPLDPARIDIGASIACSGVCLTVVERGGTAGDAWFDVDLSGETVSRTVQGMWNAGAKLNLEPSLRLGDELGGHIVTGHVDSVGEVVKVAQAGGSWQVAIRARAEMAPFIAEKGSITVNGVSLTVNDVRDRTDGTCDFLLNIIPHTAAVTTLGDLAEGDQVNLEIDVLARYLKRMQSLAAKG